MLFDLQLADARMVKAVGESHRIENCKRERLLGCDLLSSLDLLLTEVKTYLSAQECLPPLD
jgi:hypothetical protein